MRDLTRSALTRWFSGSSGRGSAPEQGTRGAERHQGQPEQPAQRDDGEDGQDRQQGLEQRDALLFRVGRPRRAATLFADQAAPETRRDCEAVRVQPAANTHIGVDNKAPSAGSPAETGTGRVDRIAGGPTPGSRTCEPFQSRHRARLLIRAGRRDGSPPGQTFLAGPNPIRPARRVRDVGPPSAQASGAELRSGSARQTAWRSPPPSEGPALRASWVGRRGRPPCVGPPPRQGPGIPTSSR